MIYTRENTFDVGRPVESVTDANGLPYDWCVECDTETGRIVKIAMAFGGKIILGGIKGMYKRETVMVPSPLLVKFHRSALPPLFFSGSDMVVVNKDGFTRDELRLIESLESFVGGGVVTDQTFQEARRVLNEVKSKVCFTVTEQRIIDMLTTGPKTKYQLKVCLDDELAKPEAVCGHIKRMRLKLIRLNRDIVCPQPLKGHYHLIDLPCR